MGEGGRLCPGLCHWRWPGRFTGRLVVIVKVEKNVPLPAPEESSVVQPEQEPVAWGVFDGPNLHDMFFTEQDAQDMARLKGDGSTVKPLYTAPPQRKPLSVCEIDELSRTMVKGSKSVNWLCRAIEVAHGIFKDEK